MSKYAIHSPLAPTAIGHYSQGTFVNNTVYLSGQIGLDPQTGQLVAGGFEAEVAQAFTNLRAVAAAAGATLEDCVKLTLFLTDLGNFAKVNQFMQQFMPTVLPARSTVGVASLPRGAQFEVEAILVIVRDNSY